ncbi:MAG TPA: hypothetical protein P5561_05155, partial [Candidatus Omnitrophota bacterium]|nr:hypothetical protein [Candidatus Omnitrophota bacterium]
SYSTGDQKMKTKWIAGILMALMLLSQGLVFAESENSIVAVAEDMTFTEDSADVAGEGIVMTDELTSPSVDPDDDDAEDVKI